MRRLQNLPAVIAIGCVALLLGAGPLNHTALVDAASTIDVSTDKTPRLLDLGVTTVGVESIALPLHGSRIVSVTVSGVPAGPGLGAYHLTLSYNPAIVQVQEVRGGSAPFQTVLTASVDNSVGIAQWTALQGSNLQGPTGDIEISRLVLSGVGSSEVCSALNLQVVELWDTNGNLIPSVDGDGSACLQVGLIGVARLRSGADADGAVGISPGIITVLNAIDLQPAPGLLLGAYSASVTYDGKAVQVLDARLKPPFDQGAVNIDNPSGIARLAALTPNGQSAPIAPLAFVTLRLLGPVGSQAVVTLDFPALVDVDGAPILLQASQERTFRRGDADGDSLISTSDVLFIAQFLVGWRELGDDLPGQVHAVNAAAIKHDGEFDRITVADALWLMQYLVGLRDPMLNLLANSHPPQR